MIFVAEGDVMDFEVALVRVVITLVANFVKHVEVRLPGARLKLDPLHSVLDRL